MLTPQKLKSIAAASGCDDYSDKTYALAGAILAETARDSAETHVDGFRYVENDDGNLDDSPDAVAEHWREQMAKD